MELNESTPSNGYSTLQLVSVGLIIGGVLYTSYAAYKAAKAIDDIQAQQAATNANWAKNVAGMNTLHDKILDARTEIAVTAGAVNAKLDTLSREVRDIEYKFSGNTGRGNTNTDRREDSRHQGDSVKVSNQPVEAARQ